MKTQPRIFSGIAMAVLSIFISISASSQVVSTANAALYKKATASSAESPSLAAGNAVDGNSSTRFESGHSDNEWLTVDLSQVFLVSNVVLSWHTDYATDFDLLFSRDGSFTDLITDSIQVRHNLLSGNFTNTVKAKMNCSARFVRMQGIHRATGNGYSLYELAVGGSRLLNGVLPVTLTDFTAVYQPPNAVLEWVTTTEFKSGGYFVERSMDGNQFTAIGYVPAVNGGTVTSHYSFNDKQVLAGKNYYRLKVTDVTGLSGYTQGVSINTNSNAGLRLYPIPVLDHLVVGFPASAGETVTISLYNPSGQPVYRTRITAQGSQQTQLISRTAEMLPGQYFLSVSTSGSKQYTQQVVLQ